MSAISFRFLLPLLPLTASLSACGGGDESTPGAPLPVSQAGTLGEHFVTRTQQVKSAPDATWGSFFIYKGQRVQVQEWREDAVSIRTGDEQVGWLEPGADGALGLLPAAGLEQRVLLSDAISFHGPEDAEPSIFNVTAGTLVYQTAEQSGRSQIAEQGGQLSLWIPSQQLSSDTCEIAVGQMMEHARWLAEENRTTGSPALAELAQETCPDAMLLPALAAQVGASLAPATARPRDLTRLLRLKLHGSSPSLAWSPDSKRLATSAGFEYEPWADPRWPDLERLYQATAGVWVMDFTNGDRKHIFQPQAYHPVWLSSQDLAWMVSAYDSAENKGFYVANSGDWQPRHVSEVEQAWLEAGHDEGALNLQPSADGSAIYYVTGSGWWTYHLDDPAPALVAPASNPSVGKDWLGPSWAPPADLVGEHCPASSGEWATETTDDGRVRVMLGDRPMMITHESLYKYRQYLNAECEDNPLSCAYLQPCFSPDGNALAFFTQGDAAQTYYLNVLQLTRPQSAGRKGAKAGRTPGAMPRPRKGPPGAKKGSKTHP